MAKSIKKIQKLHDKNLEELIEQLLTAEEKIESLESELENLKEKLPEIDTITSEKKKLEKLENQMVNFYTGSEEIQKSLDVKLE